MTKKKLINHVAIVLDDSGSMGPLLNTVKTMFAEQVNSLKQTAKSTGQEYRLSVFTFGQYVKRLCLDVPLREAESVISQYGADKPFTALINGTMTAINDLRTISTRYGDHSYLIYVVTDGHENVTPGAGPDLRTMLQELNDDWTVAVLVPNTYSKQKAIEYGFSAGNIQIWEATEQGLEAASQTMAFSNASYGAMRTAGIKSTKTLFTLPTELNKTAVKNNLEPIPAKEYTTLLVRKYDEGKEIKEFVEKITGEPYRVGSAYFQLTKPEKIQPSKMVAVVEKQTGRMFSGPSARDLLKLPDYEVKVAPADYNAFDVFVQSTSTNRHLVGNTHLVVFK